MRQRRILLGMSQTLLGKAVGLTFQQVQKYERGANRIGASRLFEFASVLDVQVSYFFGMLSAKVAGIPTRQKGENFNGTPKVGRDTDLLSKRETLQLVRAYYRIQPETVRRNILATIRSLTSQVRPTETKRKR